MTNVVIPRDFLGTEHTNRILLSIEVCFFLNIFLATEPILTRQSAENAQL